MKLVDKQQSLKQRDMKKEELKKKLEGLTLEEIADAYELFNPEFFDSRLYDIPTTRDGWVEQIWEDINNGYSVEDIFCMKEEVR